MSLQGLCVGYPEPQPASRLETTRSSHPVAESWGCCRLWWTQVLQGNRKYEGQELSIPPHLPSIVAAALGAREEEEDGNSAHYPFVRDFPLS